MPVLAIVVQWVIGLTGLPGALKSINEKLTNDNNRFDVEDKRIKVIEDQNKILRSDILSMRLMVMRNELCKEPKSKEFAGHQIDLGHEYLRLGGNGSGHIRLAVLEENFRKREERNDWTYVQGETIAEYNKRT